MNRVVVSAADKSMHTLASQFATDFSIPLATQNISADFVLEFAQECVRVLDMRSGKAVEIKVDFTEGANVHRMKYGGGKGQAIAKAVGVSAKVKPSVLDATAGMGKDAFVLAGLGCSVSMLERSPVAYALLHNGLLRARKFIEENNGEEFAQLAETIRRMQLQDGDALNFLKNAENESVNVVYLDPMFPEREKSSKVKKDMRAFQQLVGKDDDADALLDLALKAAENRVVVKRPNHAPFLAQREPGYQLKGKSSRFDIYSKKKL